MSKQYSAASGTKKDKLVVTLEKMKVKKWEKKKGSGLPG